MATKNTKPNIKPAPVDKKSQVEIARLQKLVDRYEQILSNASEGIIYINRAGTVLNANQKLHEIVKIPANKLIGKNVLTLIKQHLQPKQANIIIKLAKAALAGRQIKTFELNYQDRILEIATQKSQDNSGITGIIRDITLRKQHEAELQQTEALYRSLFEDAPIMYVTTINIKGQPIISDCNNIFIRHLGYLREQVIGQPIHNFYTAESTEQLYAGGGYQRALNSEFDLEDRDFITRKGTIIHSLIRSVPAFDADGTATGTLTLYLDITERKEAEQKLEQALKLESVLFKIVQAGGTVTDLKSLFEIVRKELTVIFDISNFYITLYDRKKDLLTFPVWADEKDQQPDTIPPGKGAVAYIINKGQSQLLTKKKLKFLADKGEVKIIGSSPTTWLGVPLKIENEIIGVMAIYHYDSNISFTDHDREVLEFVADQISKTIAKKQAEEALCESEEQFRTLYENSTIGLYRTTPSGVILLANPTLVKLLGYDSLPELQIRNLEDEIFYSDMGRDYFKSQIEQQGEINAFESSWKRKDGSIINIRESARIIRDDNGTVEYYEGTVEDITESKHREQLFEALNEIALSIEQTLNLDEIFTTVNIEFKKLGFHYLLLQIAPDQTYLQIKYHRFNSRVVKIGEQLLGLKTTDWKVYVEKSDVLHQIIQGQQTVLITDTEAGLAQTLPEIQSKFAGKLIKLLKAPKAVGAPLIIEEKVRGLLLVLSDTLTENDLPAISIFARQIAATWYKAQLFEQARRELSDRKLTEETLRISEEKYRTIIESTQEGIFIIQDNNIEFCNQRFAEIFGFDSPKEVDGSDILRLIGRKYLELVQGLIESSEYDKGETIQITCKAQRLDGCEFDADIQGSISSYRHEPAILGVIRDISEKLNLEEQLRQAQKMEVVGHLAGGIAHDFNNMLGGIMGFAELALKHVSDPEYVSDYLKNIIRKCDATSQLVQQLLAFSRKQVLDIQPLNLNSVIKGSLKFLQRVIGENIIITQDLDSEIALIHADLTALDQLITNICLNSRDAMPDGGKLLIRTDSVTIDADYCRWNAEATPGTYVRLIITDNGTGMDKTTLKGIFEPFFTTKETGKGTGLGLSMVYGLIKQHNGFIECESELDRGTSIKLYFPAQDETVEKIEPDRILLAQGGSETLLLVEDEDDLLQIIQAILEEYGYKVLTAKNGIEALRQYQAHQSEIQLIISDVVMPEMGGVSLYKNIHVKDSKIKFLFITGYTLDEAFNKYIDRDGLDLLQKPFRKEGIASKVREILDR